MKIDLLLVLLGISSLILKTTKAMNGV